MCILGTKQVIYWKQVWIHPWFYQSFYKQFYLESLPGYNRNIRGSERKEEDMNRVNCWWYMNAFGPQLQSELVDWLIVNPNVAFLSFFRTDSTDSLDSADCLPLFTDMSEHIRLDFLVLLFPLFSLVPCSRLSRLMSAFDHTLKQHLVLYNIVTKCYKQGNFVNTLA